MPPYSRPPRLGYASPFAHRVGGFPSPSALFAWRCRVRDAARDIYRPGQKRVEKRSVVALGELIRHDPIVRMYVDRMIEEVPEKDRTVDDVEALLHQLDYILGVAPEWDSEEDKRNFFPVSTLLNPMMMSDAGYSAFRVDALNEALRAILQEWCAFLDSSASRYVLNEGPNGWLCPAAVEYNQLDQFVIPNRDAPHWGWTSFNAFFHRQIKAECRPIAGPGDPKVIVSPNDGRMFRIAREVEAREKFWIKGEPYSLTDMLAGSGYLERFIGGDIFQSYLSGADFHRWHSPIDGVVRSTTLVNGLLFSNLEGTGDDKKGTKNQAYYTAVNTRGLTFIESEDPRIGMVCCMPVGITEISSITFTARHGTRVNKGDELGYFSYGGSSLALIFQPGAIDHFTVEAPEDPDKEDVLIQVNSQIARAR